MTFQKELISRLKIFIPKEIQIEIHTEKGLFRGLLTEITDNLIALNKCSSYLFQNNSDTAPDQEKTVILNTQDIIFVSHLEKHQSSPENSQDQICL